MIDIHTHVLPSIDDGAANAEISRAMLEKSVEQGVKTIVCTPHYYGVKDSPEKFLEKREKAFFQIQENFEGLGLQVRKGAEVHFNEHGVASNRALKKLAIEGTKYILIELPWMEKWTERLWRKIDKFMSDTELTPIIAHVERYNEAQKNPFWLSFFTDMGCLLQVNTGSFLEKKSSEMLMVMLKKGLVHCLGTDMHNLTDRAPEYLKAKEKIAEWGGVEAFDCIQNNMQKVLDGEKVKIHGYQPLKKFLKKYY